MHLFARNNTIFSLYFLLFFFLFSFLNILLFQQNSLLTFQKKPEKLQKKYQSLDSLVFLYKFSPFFFYIIYEQKISVIHTTRRRN